MARAGIPYLRGSEEWCEDKVKSTALRKWLIHRRTPKVGVRVVLKESVKTAESMGGAALFYLS